MSDVPTTVLWLAAIVLVLDPSTIRTLLAGAAAAAAIVMRPNLVPLAAVVGLLILMRDGVGRDGIRRAAMFTAAVLPGPLVIAALNNHLYGSPIASGYGTVETI